MVTYSASCMPQLSKEHNKLPALNSTVKYWMHERSRWDFKLNQDKNWYSVVCDEAKTAAPGSHFVTTQWSCHRPSSEISRSLSSKIYQWWSKSTYSSVGVLTSFAVSSIAAVLNRVRLWRRSWIVLWLSESIFCNRLLTGLPASAIEWPTSDRQASRHPQNRRKTDLQTSEVQPRHATDAKQTIGSNVKAAVTDKLWLYPLTCKAVHVLFQSIWRISASHSMTLHLDDHWGPRPDTYSFRRQKQSPAIDFFPAGPRAWNSLAPAVRQSDGQMAFKKLLKQLLFKHVL